MPAFFQEVKGGSADSLLMVRRAKSCTESGEAIHFISSKGKEGWETACVTVTRVPVADSPAGNAEPAE
ncbi:hypothetical protein AMQ84_00450 [Paenibacillus riograndensis]|uniref:Uncharacterized protein n=1 Tax=Paenibacillus riograndensis TaxID=483937 RepID=A0A132UD86_9BACL|nr:hypothetical protein AMQ84_00450 [Paenibacillus riograndensis]